MMQDDSFRARPSHHTFYPHLCWTSPFHPGLFQDWQGREFSVFRHQVSLFVPWDHYLELESIELEFKERWSQKLFGARLFVVSQSKHRDFSLPIGGLLMLWAQASKLSLEVPSWSAAVMSKTAQEVTLNFAASWIFPNFPSSSQFLPTNFQKIQKQSAV